MDEYNDLPYSVIQSSRDPPHEFDLYVPRTIGDMKSPPPLVCFIHGGAWRSEDKSHHSDLARKLVSATEFVVAVPNYRLTPSNPSQDNQLQHPAHAEDILLFLAYILTWDGPSSTPVYDPSRIYLAGHSCGAHILTSIFLDSSSITPSLTPSPVLLHAVKGVIVSEGIYDLPLLLQSFPEYLEWFIENAFGERENYASFSTTSLGLRGTPHIRWLVIHSKGDTLVDELQSRAIYDNLCRLYENAGLSDQYVTKNWDELDEEHNDLLRGDKYIQIVANYLLGDSLLSQ